MDRGTKPLDETSFELGAAEQTAVRYTPAVLRPKLASFFALDRRLGQIGAQTTEPMLGQMRLAWWRDVLRQDRSDRPGGDAVLDAVSAHWTGLERPLVALVDGWEHMLAEPPLSEGHAEAFIEGRSEAIAAIADQDLTVRAAARLWACADAKVHTANQAERQVFEDIGLKYLAENPPSDTRYRGIAVLRALAKRSLLKGGPPLMEGRVAALVAIRAGFIGR